MKKIAVLVGSNRRESINLKYAKALAKLGGDRFDFRFADLVAMPMFNDDLTENYPASAQALKDLVAEADGVLMVTPEYNRSIPALLKSAIDWGTRPPGKNSWNGKPGAITGTSPGVIGTAVAQFQLRSIMLGLGLRVMGSPEVFLQMKEGLIDDDFEITNEDTRKFLGSFLDKFDKWIDQVSD